MMNTQAKSRFNGIPIHKLKVRKIKKKEFFVLFWSCDYINSIGDLIKLPYFHCIDNFQFEFIGIFISMLWQ